VTEQARSSLCEGVRQSGARHFVRRLRPFHFGTIDVRGGAPAPLGLWISSGYDHSVNKPFLNVTLFGRFRGRVYSKEIR
jgi:hypothetical protein